MRPAEGESLLRPLRESTAPIADLVGPITYEQQQTLLDDGFPFGLQNYWKSEFLKSLTDDAIALMPSFRTPACGARGSARRA